ncbi:MAG: hypothetical protein OES26_21080, partial [Gammaproteobacteria bacterium]|nr:hypothetical protein [Gammaproteobacteria bacterium]
HLPRSAFHVRAGSPGIVDTDEIAGHPYKPILGESRIHASQSGFLSRLTLTSRSSKILYYFLRSTQHFQTHFS